MKELDDRAVIDRLMDQFGDDAVIGRIAQYAEDEFMIPKELAVKLIVERAFNSDE